MLFCEKLKQEMVGISATAACRRRQHPAQKRQRSEGTAGRQYGGKHQLEWPAAPDIGELMRGQNSKHKLSICWQASVAMQQLWRRVGIINTRSLGASLLPLSPR